MTKSNDYVGMRRERRHFSLTKQNIQDFDDNFLIQHSINNCFLYHVFGDRNERETLSSKYIWTLNQRWKICMYTIETN